MPFGRSATYPEGEDAHLGPIQPWHVWCITAGRLVFVARGQRLWMVDVRAVAHRDCVACEPAWLRATTAARRGPAFAWMGRPWSSCGAGTGPVSHLMSRAQYVHGHHARRNWAIDGFRDHLPDVPELAERDEIELLRADAALYEAERRLEVGRRFEARSATGEL